MTCDDGVRSLVDPNEFVEETSRHAERFVARVKGEPGRLLDLEPSLRRSLEGAALEASRFGGFLAENYNRCAVTQFQLDELSEHAREADRLVGQLSGFLTSSAEQEFGERLDLADEYVERIGALAGGVSNIARAHQAAGELAAAQTLANRALEMAENIHGTEHPNVAVAATMSARS